MREGPANDETGQEFWNDPVVSSLLAQLEAEYSDWRKTTHYAPTGQKVMMIEFADNQGRFVDGLPNEFVSMVSTAGLDDDD